MIVLPSSIWKKEAPRRVIPRVIIYEASVEAAGSRAVTSGPLPSASPLISDR
jgi:hypothetical protein